MSLPVVDWVLKNSPHRNGHRMVLVAIAHHAHDDGTGAWPCLATLAKESGLSIRQVQRAIADLEEAGALAVKRGTGRRASRYTVLGIQPSLLDEGVENAVENRAEAAAHVTPGVTSATSRGDTHVTQTYKEPSLNLKDETASAAREPQEPYELEVLVPSEISHDPTRWTLAKLAAKDPVWRALLDNPKDRALLKRLGQDFRAGEVFAAIEQAVLQRTRIRNAGAWLNSRFFPKEVAS